MQAMILAAGFGTRLLPFTRFRAKPLFPILNRPLLLLTIQRLQNAGFNHVLINCFHLKEQIREAVIGLKGVVLVEEDIILGTGGGIRNAMEMMRDEPILITNGDIYHTIPYANVYQEHLDRQCHVTLCTHDYPRFNCMEIVANLVMGFDSNENEAKAFTGIHVLNPEILQDIKGGEKSCILDLYRSLIKKGLSPRASLIEDCYWTDMGTVPDYLELNRGILEGQIPAWKEIGNIDSHQYFGTEAVIEDGSRIEGWCVIGNNSGVKKGAFVSNSVVWENVEIKQGRKIIDTIADS